MRLQDHLSKISWTIADKTLFLGYGVVRMLQIRSMSPSEWGLFSLLDVLVMFAITITDNLTFVSIIRFAAEKERRAELNSTVLFLGGVLSVIVSVLMYVFRENFAYLLSEQRFIEVCTSFPFVLLLSLPRFFAVKIMYRDLAVRTLFFVNAVWFGSMTIASLYYIHVKNTIDFSSMFTITIVGLVLSGSVGLWLVRRELVFGKISREMVEKVLSFGASQIGWTAPVTAMKQLDGYIVQYFFGTAVVGVYQSARTLYRFVDAAFDAISGIFFPALVRVIAEKNTEKLRALISKTISFTLLIMLFSVICVEIGLGELLIRLVLSDKYIAAVGQFRVMIVASVFSSFSLLSSLLVATGEMKKLTQYSFSSFVVGIIVLILLSKLGFQSILPLGVVTFHFVQGYLYWKYTKQKIGLNTNDVFRSIRDISNFIKNKYY